MEQEVFHTRFLEGRLTVQKCELLMLTKRTLLTSLRDSPSENAFSGKRMDFVKDRKKL